MTGTMKRMDGQTDETHKQASRQTDRRIDKLKSGSISMVSLSIVVNITVKENKCLILK